MTHTHKKMFLLPLFPSLFVTMTLIGLGLFVWKTKKEENSSVYIYETWNGEWHERERECVSGSIARGSLSAKSFLERRKGREEKAWACGFGVQQLLHMNNSRIKKEEAAAAVKKSRWCHDIFTVSHMKGFHLISQGRNGSLVSKWHQSANIDGGRETHFSSTFSHFLFYFLAMKMKTNDVTIRHVHWAQLR
jgi:hypothetical protein